MQKPRDQKSVDGNSVGKEGRVLSLLLRDVLRFRYRVALVHTLPFERLRVEGHRVVRDVSEFIYGVLPDAVGDIAWHEDGRWVVSRKEESGFGLSFELSSAALQLDAEAIQATTVEDLKNLGRVAAKIISIALEGLDELYASSPRLHIFSVIELPPSTSLQALLGAWFGVTEGASSSELETGLSVQLAKEFQLPDSVVQATIICDPTPQRQSVLIAKAEMIRNERTRSIHEELERLSDGFVNAVDGEVERWLSARVDRLYSSVSTDQQMQASDD